MNCTNKWNISFAGCGFLGVYYFGVYWCLLERAHELLNRTVKICGASSGALIGAMIACQMSPAKCCENMMEMARKARKGKLGSVHPSFNLLKLTRDLMTRDLPDNAHILASGRLCVSLTRVSDGQNVLVSDFKSKDDLIQALMCSCFFPLFCGVVPPSYHGIRYVDGALSNNLPYFNLKNTITVSPFSGESDICPYENPFYFHEIRHSNVSILVNFTNVHRVIQAFFPPEPEIMEEICLNGYKDTLHFLKDNDLLKLDSPLTSCVCSHKNGMWCSCTQCYIYNQSTADSIQHGEKERTLSCYEKKLQKPVDEFEINLLPDSIQKVFTEATMKEHRRMNGELFVVKLTTSVLMLCFLPLELIYAMLASLWYKPRGQTTFSSIGHFSKTVNPVCKTFMRHFIKQSTKFADWTPEMSSDLQWLCKMTGQMIRLGWRRLCSKRPEHKL